MESQTKRGQEGGKSRQDIESDPTRKPPEQDPKRPIGDPNRDDDDDRPDRERSK